MKRSILTAIVTTAMLGAYGTQVAAVPPDNAYSLFGAEFYAALDRSDLGEVVTIGFDGDLSVLTITDFDKFISLASASQMFDQSAINELRSCVSDDDGALVLSLDTTDLDTLASMLGHDCRHPATAADLASFTASLAGENDNPGQLGIRQHSEVVGDGGSAGRIASLLSNGFTGIKHAFLNGTTTGRALGAA